MSPANRHQSLNNYGLDRSSSSQVKPHFPGELLFDSAFKQAELKNGKQTALVQGGNAHAAAQTVQPAKATAAGIGSVAAIPNSPATNTPATLTVNTSSGHSTNAIKIEASPPFRFGAVNLDTGIEDWLDQVQENCKFGRLDLSNWVVFASGDLDGQSKTEWLEHKKEARSLNNTDEVMQWDHFVAWCRKHLTVLNRDKVAFDKLKLHKQTGSVSKYMSTFNLLCAQAKIPDAYRLHLWYDGLKPDVRSKTEFDQTTKQRYACIADAQSAALAVDSFTLLLTMQALPNLELDLDTWGATARTTVLCLHLLNTRVCKRTHPHLQSAWPNMTSPTCQDLRLS